MKEECSVCKKVIEEEGVPYCENCGEPVCSPMCCYSWVEGYGEYPHESEYCICKNCEYNENIEDDINDKA